MSTWWLLLIPVVVVVAVLLVRRLRGEPSGWHAGPIIGGKLYGSAVCDASGSFDFPTTDPGVHYLTRETGPLTGIAGLRLRYRIDAEPDVQFVGVGDGIPVVDGPYIYVQRRGDDWSGVGEFEAYRWWGPCGKMTPGEHEVVALFTDRWSAVQTSTTDSSMPAFSEALRDAARVGVTFPNNAGRGHGTRATGPARFVLLGLDVVPLTISG